MMIKTWSSQELDRKYCVYLGLYKNMQHETGWIYLITRYEDKYWKHLKSEEKLREG